jgi:oligoendopeptidase F
MFDDLRPLKPRHYLDPGFHAENPLHVARFLKQLSENHPHDFRSAHEWFSLFHEGSIAIQDVHARLEIATQLDTDSQEANTRLRNFEEKVLSQLLLIRKDLMEVYLTSPWRLAMHADDKGRIAKDFAIRKQYAKPVLAKLQIEENEIVRNYKRFVNSASVFLENNKIPLPVLVGRMNENNPEIRRKAFFAYWKYVHENEKTVQSFFTELVKNRKDQAAAIGEKSFTPIAFAELGRIDYGEKECSILRNTIERVVVPRITHLSKTQAMSLNEPTIAPWNVNIWPALMPQQPPAQGNIENLLAGLHRILMRTEPAFATLLETMRQKNVIDILPGPRKAPGAFCVTLQESGVPFIFGNFAGNTKDAMTLLHEFGHALHSHASSYIANTLLRTPGMEFCEVMSTSMELLTFPALSEWWSDPRDVTRAQAFHLFGMLNFWPFMAMVDEWQHAIYAHPDCLDPKVRNEIWKTLSARFRPHVDWSGAEEFECLGWFARPHVFTAPFYYVDYGIAQVGALQLWEQSRSRPKKAIEAYITGLALGGQRSLPELFESMGVEFDLTEKTIARLIAELEKTIAASIS